MNTWRSDRHSELLQENIWESARPSTFACKGRPFKVGEWGIEDNMTILKQGKEWKHETY
jgi:hypothetical protein